MEIHFPMDASKRARKSRGSSACWWWFTRRDDPVVEEEDIPSKPDMITSRRTHEWTIVHSYFAVMGGFAVEVAKECLNFFPTMADGKTRHTRLALSPDALLYLEEQLPGFVPDLPKLRIKDKSNGSMLAKSIVCFQAIWFCIQCLSRISQGLAISLLELNTFGHAVCTVLIYSLWWSKPLDIEEPEVITVRDDEKASAIIARMCSLSKVELLKPYREDRRRFHVVLDAATTLGRVRKPYPDVARVFRAASDNLDCVWASMCADR